MTVKNLITTVIGSTVYLQWQSTEDYIFIFEDAEIVARLSGSISTYTLPYTNGAVYQVADSVTSTDPALPYNVPQRRCLVYWQGDSDVERYELHIGQTITPYRGGETSYTHRTNRLGSGSYEIKLKAFDSAGNESDSTSTMDLIIDDVPNRINGLSLSQSGAGNITATVTP